MTAVRVVIPAILALAYAIAVVAASWAPPGKGFLAPIASSRRTAPRSRAPSITRSACCVASPAEDAAAAAELLGEVSGPHDEVMESIERKRLTSALRAAGGNQSHAAKAIGMPRTTFINKLRRYGML